MPDVVLTEVRDQVLVVTLNRPDARNAIDAALADGVIDAVERLAGDETLRAAVLTGAGPGFCSGMDLKAFASGNLPTRLLSFLQKGTAKPMVAAVEGFAVAGGLELALSCDLIVAARNAMFGIPEVRVGLFAAGGALARLPQRVPRGVALEMALTGDAISAEDGLRYGLVARLTEPGGAEDAALDLAGRIAANAPLAVAASRRLIAQAYAPVEQEYWGLQQPHIDAVFRSADAGEGRRAFAEKRAPVWSGR